MVKHLDHSPKRLRLGDQVAGLLLAAIRLHDYLPGQRLPSERELGLRLGVNRMAIREGLRWLESQRYIEIRRGKHGGAFVCQPARELSLQRLVGRVEQLRQLFEYRSVVEPFAAALAAEHITSDEIERLRALAAAEIDEPLRFKRQALDVELHQTIAGASRNQLVAAAVRDIRVQLGPGLDLISESSPRLRESHQEHVRIVTALAAANVSGARRAMHRHVVATEREIRGMLVELSVKAEPDTGRTHVELGDHAAGVAAAISMADLGR